MLSTSFISRSAKTSLNRKLRNSRQQLLNIKFSSYASNRSRELTVRNKIKSVSQPALAKRRFISLPMRLLVNKKALVRQRLKSERSDTHDRQASLLLQAALQNRFFTRRMRDLRKASRRRRAVYTKRTQFWKRFKVARRLRKAKQFAMYNVATAHSHKRASSFQWAMSEFTVRVPKKIRKKVTYVTAFGELLTRSASTSITKSPRLKKVKAHRLRSRTRVWKPGFSLATRRQRRPKLKSRRRPRWWRQVRPRKSFRKQIRKKYKYDNYKRILPVFASRAVLSKLDNVKDRLNHRLVSQTRPTVLLSPFHFRRPSSSISATTEEKQQLHLFVQASKKRRYRRLSEFSEAVTNYFPQLIRKLMEKKLKGQTITKKDAAGMVQSIYWNLRVYLQKDLTGDKLENRYKLAKQFSQLRREVANNAEHRYFTQMDLRTTRYRFQPHHLHPPHSLRRGALRWLRQFLPKFYELHLEDPEKYKHLTLTPIKVFRSHINSGATVNWETRKIPGRMEDRFIKLTTERRSRNSSRFENMLMTTRRTPAIGGYGAAAALHVINHAGISTARTSFFRRPFSTASNLFKPVRILNLGIVSTKISAQLRQRTTEKKVLSDAVKAFTHRTVKNSFLSKTQILPTYGSIDIRNTRLKSPRSTDYLHRKSSINQQNRVSHKVLHADKQGGILRETRRTFRKNKSQLPNYKRFSSSTSTYLPVLRSYKITRRVAAALKVAQATAAKNTIKKKLKPLLAKNRKSRLLKKNFLVKIAQGVKKNKKTKSLTTTRSILHFRQAAMRSPYTYFTPAPILPHRALQLKRLPWAVLWARKYGQRLSKKFHLENKNAESSLGRLRNRGAKVAAVSKFKPIKRKVSKRNRFKTKLWLNEIKYSRNQSSINTKRSSTLFLNTKKVKFSHKWNNSTKLARLRSHFFSHAKEARENSKVISKHANAAERRRSFIMFTRRRKRLWGHLTLRWMKKKRLLKGWLKFVKISFKDKSWVAAVNYAIRSSGGTSTAEALSSDVLFKESRLRLRRLEWRERSDRFDRQGFRNAFTFHPRERGNAPWLESLMFTRSAYNFQRMDYKRDQFPREQKHKKWLQRLRKSLYRKNASHVYIRGRRWPLLRMYSQRLHRSLFQLRNTKVALKRFRKLSRRKTKNSGFEKSMTGFGDRMDVNLLLLNLAPTVFWARRMAGLGLLRVNGVRMPKSTFRFKVGDYVEWAWDKIQRFQSYFVSHLKKRGYTDLFKNTSFELPSNFTYYPKLRSAHYARLPKLTDLPESARLNARMFRWFQLDSGLGK
jgi:hypothetical protein